MARTQVSQFRSAIAAVLAIVVLCFAPGTRAVAQEGAPQQQPSQQPPSSGGLGIEPATTPGARRTSFLFEVAPGGVQDDSVTVSNVSDNDLSVVVYAANGFNTSTGLIAIRPDNYPKTGVVTWLKFSADLPTGALTLAPRTSKTIPFRLTIPPDALPGDYAFGIGVVQPTTTPITTPGQSTTQVQRAVAVAALLRVQGPLHGSVRIGSLSLNFTPPVVPGLITGQTDATFEVRNDGNTRLNADVEIVEHDLFGRTIHTEHTKLPNLLPDTKLLVRRSWHTAPIGYGSIDVNVRTDDPTGVGATRSKSAWSLSWQLVVAMLVLLWISYRLVRGLVRRRRARREMSSEAAGEKMRPLETAGDR